MSTIPSVVFSTTIAVISLSFQAMAVSFVDWFSNSKQMFKQSLSSKKQLHIVSGNQAADLDSVVSACTMAYYLSTTINLPTVGLVCIPKAELRLRTEVTFMFKHAGLDWEKLLFLDELAAEQISSLDPSFVSVTLVDHNSPAPSLSFLSPFVIEIIDHHEDSKKEYAKLQEKRIETVGSCSTLVAEKFLQNSKFLEILKQQSELKLLVEGTILVDTINLAPEMGKVTPKDTEILHKLLNLEHQPRDTNSLYKLLNEAKFDCSSLTISELLIKDYKDWELGNTKYGISSITAPVSRLADPSVEKILSKFCEENKLVFLICMTAHSTTGSFAREMVVYLGNSSEKKAPSKFTTSGKGNPRFSSDTRGKYKRKFILLCSEEYQVFTETSTTTCTQIVIKTLIKYTS